jgi:tRNA A37 threonylcarbamoyladenosine dehydratase
MTDWLSRTQLVLGSAATSVLSRSRVAVFGIGGVGGYAAEALARSGVGSLDLVDSDVVELTNLNRQIVATRKTLGMPKVDAMAARIVAINPQCQVAAHRCFYSSETKGQFDFTHYDYVIDAVDTVTAKLQLVEEAQRCGTPIVCSMGAADKLDPSAFEVADIYDTSVCPLAKIVRKECRKRSIGRLKVVYSKEPARQPLGNAPGEAPAAGRHTVPGSVAFVPPVVGLILAGEVVKDLVGLE